MSYKTGLDSMFFGRSDYRELKMRYQNSSLEYLWQSSKTFPDAKIFTVQLFGQGKYGVSHFIKGEVMASGILTNVWLQGYYSWYPFEETNARDRNYVQDDMTMQDYNVKEWIDRIVSAAQHQASQTRTNHQLWMLGNDFTFQAASRWYTNYDKLIHYVNMDGRVRIFYSTPSEYVKAKHRDGKDWGRVRTTDLFPLADGPHEYWTGYFTSRPSLKRQYRYSSALLAAARQMETVFKINFPKSRIVVGNDTGPRTATSPAGTGWTDDLEGALAVVAHHDGITGTARQSVTNDYANRLSMGAIRAEKAAVKVLEKLVGIVPGGSAGFCNCNTAGPQDCLLNMSSCSHTTRQEAFTVVAWNSLSANISTLMDIPVTGTHYQVHAANGSIVPSAIVEIDSHTKALPLLYLNDFNMTPSEVWKELSRLENRATHRLIFQAELPAAGFNAFRVNLVKPNDKEDQPLPPSSESLIYDEYASTNQPALETNGLSGGERPPMVVENHLYKIELSFLIGRVIAITNKRTSKRFPFEIEWGFYRSSVGGCTKEKPELDACMSQASGAYLFRPNETDVHWKSSKPTLSKVRKLAHGLGVEIVQKYSPWISQTIRLDNTIDAVQVEWTVGPIPIEDRWGKEVVVRYKAQGIHSEGQFFTDSNGRESVLRVRDERSPDVCDPEEYSACKRSLKHERVSSNYYPVNAFIAVEDSKSSSSLAVVVDTSHGGTSMEDGSIELMTHRRVLHDDFRGVEEPLNETMCGCGDINAPPGQMGAHGHLGDGGCNCVGLAIRGKHFLVLDDVAEVRKTRRLLSNRMAGFPQLAFFENGFLANITSASVMSPILNPAFAVPPNIHLLTFCSNYENGTLVRFSHSFEKDEHDALSKTVSFPLRSVFKAKIKSAKEYSLSGNQPIEQLLERQKQRVWVTQLPSAEAEEPSMVSTPASVFSQIKSALRGGDDLVVTLQPMDVRTYWVKFEEGKEK